MKSYIYLSIFNHDIVGGLFDPPKGIKCYSKIFLELWTSDIISGVKIFQISVMLQHHSINFKDTYAYT